MCKGAETIRAFRGHHQLDHVHRSGIGMHPGASLVLHADLQRFTFEGSESGKIAILGSGFRYVADSDNHEPDSFTLVVLGKHRRDRGNLL